MIAGGTRYLHGAVALSLRKATGSQPLEIQALKVAKPVRQHVGTLDN